MGKVKDLVKVLNKKGFKAQSFDTMVDAKEQIKKIVKSSESIGTGGSVTLRDSEILQDLREMGCKVTSYMLDKPKDGKDHIRMRNDAHKADWFMASSNAITLDGCLVNIDGTGNRVSAITFGSSKLMIVVGKNKIVKNYKKAIKRIKTEACGKNARRLGLPSPCGIDNICHDCSGKGRMCNVTSLIEYPPGGREIHIIIVKEDWGY